MATVTRYAIEKIDTGQIVKRYNTIPRSFEVTINGRNRRIISPVKVGDEGLGYRFIEIVEVDFMQPGQFYHKGETVTTRTDTDTITVTQNWTPWTQVEIDAWNVSRLDETANVMDQIEDVTRAAVLVIMDELNLHSTRMAAIIEAGANASSLANFRSAMQSIQPIPQRTAAQLKTAIRNKLGV